MKGRVDARNPSGHSFRGSGTGALAGVGSDRRPRLLFCGRGRPQDSDSRGRLSHYQWEDQQELRDKVLAALGQSKGEIAAGNYRIRQP